MRKCWQFLRERGAVKAIAGIVALLGACAVAAGLVLLLAVGPTKPKQAALPKDDSDTIYPLDALNPTSPTFGGVTYPLELFNSLSSEDPGRQYEEGFSNCVSVEANANSCLGGTSAGLTMTPGSCIAYNKGWRGTETGSITFPNSSTCWVAMDENTSGNNAGLSNFTRVTATHYLIDCIDATQPTMVADSQLLMKVTTSGGAITIVKDLRNICAFGSCGGGTLNGVINVMDFGARGDTVLGGDGTVGSGSYNFTSASFNCTAARVGETIHVIAANTSAALLLTTVASCSGNTFVMAVAAQETISGTARWVIGHDDTTAIQTAQSASYVNGFTTNALYFPAGRYLVTAPLNFTMVSNAHIYGDGQDVSTIFCSSSGQSLCVDASGGGYNQWDHLTIFSGAAVQDAPNINFLKARTTNGGAAIGDTYRNVAFKAYSPFNFYGSYNEQAAWHDVYWEADGTNTVNLTLSTYNTAGITSPFVTLVPSNHTYASTDFTIEGSDTAFTSNNGGGVNKPHIWLDGGFQNINMRDFYFGDSVAPAPAVAGMSLIGDLGVAGYVQNLKISGIIGNMLSSTALIVNLPHFNVDHVYIDGRNDPASGNSSIWQLQFNTIKNSKVAFQTNQPKMIQATFCAGTDLPGATDYTSVSCPYANFVAGNVKSTRVFIPTTVLSQIDGLFVYGGMSVSAIPDPLAPTVTSHCTVVGSEQCNSSCTYYVEYLDINWDTTNPSPGTTITNCPNAPNTTNYVVIMPHLTGSEFMVALLKNSTTNELGYYYPSDYQTNPGGYGNDVGQTPVNTSFIPGPNDTGRLHLENGNGIGCSGLQVLATGAATVANGCISGKRPVICTDNSGSAAEAVTCVPAVGSLVIHGNSTDTIGWVQL
jgi:hypothetical protein